MTKTHKLAYTHVTSTHKIRNKKYTTNHTRAAIFCTGELFEGPWAWAIDKGIVASRWKKVNCKKCIRSK